MRYVTLLIFISISLSFAAYNRTSTYVDVSSFLTNNKLPQCPERPIQPRMVRSYWAPQSYFDSVPANQRIPPVHQGKTPQFVAACNRVVDVAGLNNYEFQTERLLSAIGLNIYDGAVWSMAVSKLGQTNDAIAQQTYIINEGTTCQFPDVRGDMPCKGVLVTGECSDPTHSGNCGFCYGNGNFAERSLQKSNAWSFRMISDYWALDGTVDERCPELGNRWTWNDYRPVLGENSWAFLIGPLQVAYIKWGSVAAIPSNDLSIQMAINFLPSLVKQLSPIGAVYYAPKNTLAYGDRDAGFDISTENNISLLGGLKMLRYILSQKSIHLDKLGDINNLITNIENYIKLSYDPVLGYFRQGGSYSASGVFSWATGDIAFAVDCQTWAMTVVSPLLIDQWFGSGTSIKIWETTKRLGGYNCHSGTGFCDGLGFTTNAADQVFSGEWTLGGINMLRVFANEYNNQAFLTEAKFMRDAIEAQLVASDNIEGTPVTGVLYANKRYWIPFGWWANKLISTISTAWTVLVDKDFNPFHLGGAYRVNY